MIFLPKNQNRRTTFILTIVLKLKQGLLYTGHELDFWPIQLVGNVAEVTTIHLVLKMSLKPSKIYSTAKIPLTNGRKM